MGHSAAWHAVLLAFMVVYDHGLPAAARLQDTISSDSSDYTTISPSDAMVSDHPCTLKPCLHDGTCVPNGVSFICDCPDGFSGDFCQQPVANPNPVFYQPPSYPKSVSEAAQTVVVVNVEPPAVAVNTSNGAARPSGIPVQDPNTVPVSPRALAPETPG